MTTFSFPVNIKRPEMDATGAGVVTGRVPTYYSVPVTLGMTGVGPGATTLPLFVAPAGSRVYDCVIDVITGADQTANTNIQIGTPTSTGIVFAATSANTAGRRAQTMTGAQVSANAIVFSADTTVQAIVSIDTSAIGTLETIVHVILI